MCRRSEGKEEPISSENLDDQTSNTLLSNLKALANSIGGMGGSSNGVNQVTGRCLGQARVIIGRPEIMVEVEVARDEVPRHGEERATGDVQHPARRPAT